MVDARWRCGKASQYCTYILNILYIIMSGISIDTLGWIIILIYTNHIVFLAKNKQINDKTKPVALNEWACE